MRCCSMPGAHARVGVAVGFDREFGSIFPQTTQLAHLHVGIKLEKLCRQPQMQMCIYTQSSLVLMNNNFGIDEC